MKHLLAIALLALLTSCVTMIRGTTHEVRVTSTPSGAHFQLGTTRGRTPATVTVERSNRKDLLFHCWQADRAEASQNVSPAEVEDAGITMLLILDALLIVPGIVDLATHSFWDYPSEIHAELPPATPGTRGHVRLGAWKPNLGR